MSFILHTLLIRLLAVAAAAQELSEERIINGESIDIQEVPWQVALNKDFKGYCGGSIMSDRIILTAAHCLEGRLPVDLTVRAGSNYVEHGGQLVNVQDFKIHKDYKNTPQALYNDVGVVILAEPLIFGPGVRSINLAQENPKNGESALVTGWGLLYDSTKHIVPRDLQGVYVAILDRKTCLETSIFTPSEVTDDMICASSPDKDACSGDSGGALVVNGIQVGIVSWGEGCARYGLPGIYASAVSYHTWIQDAIKDLESRQ